MEAGQNKNRINKIFEDYFDRTFEFELNNHIIECNYQVEFDEKNNEENTKLSDSDSFIFITEYFITNDLNNVTKIERFPYSSIRILSVKFPKTKEIFKYTCFLINDDIVVTLSSNLNNSKEGGKAISIKTSFSEKEVKQDNIYLEEDFEIKNEEEYKQKATNNYSKLAVILYEVNVSKSWVGVDADKKENLYEFTLHVAFYPGSKELEDKKILREIYLPSINPFKEYQKEEDQKEIDEILKHCSDSPIYYTDDYSNTYVIAIINKFYDIQYFNNKNLTFLCYMVREARLRKKNTHFTDLDLSEKNRYISLTGMKEAKLRKK